ncbi:MAG: hypothetical protein ACLT3Y_04605 [Ruminococcus callidus]
MDRIKYNRLFTNWEIRTGFSGWCAGIDCRKLSYFHRTSPISGVYYQAVMSRMHSAFSAPFPLWLGYFLNRRKAGENDGLVPVVSAKLEWAPFLMVPETKRRGVSHGDMIDLNRENIPDFDVREWYSQLVQKLKQNGF